MRTITAYKAVRFALFFDAKYTYIALTHAFTFDPATTLTRDEKKQFADSFTMEVNAGKPNLRVYEYVSRWKNKLFTKKGLKTAFPQGSNTDFIFVFRSKSALLGVSTGLKYTVQIPQTIDKRRVVFKGIEAQDIDLVFYCPPKKCTTTDFHPMRGLIINAPFDYSLNDNVSGTRETGQVNRRGVWVAL
jgi:hypothetical protein